MIHVFLSSPFRLVYPIFKIPFQCDRVRRKRTSLVGSVRLIHSDNLDDVDTKLNAARYTANLPYDAHPTCIF